MSVKYLLWKIARFFRLTRKQVNRICKKFFSEIKLYIEVLWEFIHKDKPIKSDVDLGNNVKLYYWRYDIEYDKAMLGSENLGDYLSNIVVSHFIPQNKLSMTRQKAITIYGIGSILGFRCQNAVVWGSGILHPNKNYLLRAKYSSMDIRAVRGPNTRNELLKLNKSCPDIYGDPAILMPYVFNPSNIEKKYDVTVIFNYFYNNFETPKGLNINYLNIITNDYKDFITQIMQSKLVISSSLHGIILAETYGVPAILLLEENQSIFKYEDWYFSTGRFDIVTASSIQEALTIEPMLLPDLNDMQSRLIDAFPYDIWSN